MALPPLADVNALEEWLGLEADSLEGADAARAGAYLAAASTLVRGRTGRVWLAEGDELDTDEPTIDEDDLEVAKTVVLQVAERKWRNPSGAVQQTTGPFSSTFAAAAALGLYLSEEDELQLIPFKAAGAAKKLFTIATTREPWAPADQLIDTLPQPQDPIAYWPPGYP